MSVMAQKNRNKKCQVRMQKFFSKKNFFFGPKFSKNLYFWRLLVKSSTNLVSLQSSIAVWMRAIAQNDHNTILLRWVKNNFKILPSKTQKNCWAQNWQKMTKKSKIFRHYFLVEIDLEWSKLSCKMIISSLKIFPIEIFSWTSPFFSKNGT